VAAPILADGAGSLLARLQAKDRGGHGQETVVEATAELDNLLAPPFPRQQHNGPERPVSSGQFQLRGGKFGALTARLNYPDCKFTRKWASRAVQDGADTGLKAIASRDAGITVKKSAASVPCIAALDRAGEWPARPFFSGDLP